MKKVILLLMLGLGLPVLGCNGIFNPPAAPVPVATPTPTAVPTPVCGFTPLTNSFNWPTVYVAPSTYAIHNSTDWTNDNGASAAVPAVDFHTQMVLEVFDRITVSCMCLEVPPSITSVCVYPDHIEVDYQLGGQSCPDPMPPYSCNSIFTHYEQVLVAIPQSNLPVTWVANP